MNFSDYLAIDAVNASRLKRAAVSPLHYITAEDRPPSPAMLKGSAIHCACLEPLEFPLRYMVWDGTRTTKAWKEFKAAVPDGTTILTADEFRDCAATAEAVRNHPVAMRYIEGAATEHTLTWTDEDTGLPCKARCDLLNAGYVGDLKSARDIGERAFSRQTHDLLYHLQAAHYLAGYRANYTLPDPFFVFILVESSPPHDVRVGRLTEDALYAGEQERTRLLRLVRDCTESGEWPGAYPEETEVDLPEWYYAQAESIEEALL